MTSQSGNNKPPSATFTNSDEIKKVFNRFDTNGDGRISATELIQIMKSIGSNSSSSDDEINQMMSTIDTDCDGYINLAEFTAFCKGTADDSDGGMKELHEAFEMYDLNKNGLISSIELHQILSRLGEKCTAEDCVKMIQTVDSDGDGYVNFEEFRKMMSAGGGGGGGGGGGLEESGGGGAP